MSSSAPCFVVPGLVWPAADIVPQLDATFLTALPGLARLLAGSTPVRAPAQPFDDWLCETFALRPPAPLAALRLAGEPAWLTQQPEPADGHWLCADPVSMRFARDQLLLGAQEDLAIAPEDALAMVADLNAQFGDIGQFFAATPQRWYLRCVREPKVELPSLADAAGRPVAYFQPEGEERALWARTINELQVFCHNHPLNARREAAGQAPINALWLWGAGTPQTPTAPGAVRGDAYPLLAGLCRSAGAACDMTGAYDLTAALQLFMPLHEAAQQRDAQTWLAALRQLDARLLTPLADALDSGQLRTLRLVSPSDRCLLTLTAQARPRWKFWGRRATPAALVDLLHMPSPNSTLVAKQTS